VRGDVLNAIAYSDGEVTERGLLVELLNGQADLWRCAKAVCIGRIVRYENCIVYSLPIIAGVDFEEWKHLEEFLAGHASARGATKLEGYARRGWLRKAPHWRFVYEKIRRDL
jgi:hypothetical protein